jgi:Domain of unknown function (DUF5011)/Bacterial Ig domain/FG-GAP-like repeat/Domain of unknown function DUF11
LSVRVPIRVSMPVLAAITLLAGVALASGFPPFALDDAVTVPRGGQATLLDSGAASVLANDIDLEGDPLTAELTREPRDGTVVLNPDGTFVYTHDGSSSGSDEFRYRAFDGTRDSREATVRISVTAPAAAPRITGQREITTFEEQPVTVTFQDLIVSDQDSPYPNGFTLTIADGEGYSVQGTTVVPDPNFSGELTVPTRVNDGQLDSNEFPLRIEVRALNDAPTVTQAIGEQQAAEGEFFSLNVAAAFADVDSGDTLTFTATGLPPSGSLRLSLAGSLTGTPLEVDTLVLRYRIIVTARDRGGASASTEFGLTIQPRRVDLSTGITAQPEPTTVGAAPQWSFQVTNLSNTSSEAVGLTGDWYSTGGAVTLTTTGSCIINNASQVQCDIPALPPGGSATVRVQSAQSAPGDQAVIARLDTSDANDANNAAFKSLNLAGSFNEGPAQRLLGASSDLAVGDLDDDGHLDLVAAGNGVRVFFNTGAKTFATPAVTPAGSAGDTLALVDWNGDALGDIAVLRSDGGAGRILRNDGARAFVAGAALPAISARAAAVIDANLDGLEELAVTGAAGTAILTPGANPNMLDGRAGRDVATADWNGDGRGDLAVALDDGTVVVFTSTASGSFARATLTGFGDVTGVGAGDLSGDGVPDLLLTTSAADLAVPENLVLRNDGNGSFAEIHSFGATETEQLLVGDVDADGSADVVAINASGVHQVYLGGSTSELALQSEFLLSPGSSTAALADLDSDGVPDLFLGGADAPSIEVLRNNGIGRFGPGDVVRPVISLIGAASLTVAAASTYVDPGATATDDVSGDLSAAIVVNNPVNAAVVGTYQVSYDVTDRAGNAGTTAFRTVIVEAATGGGGGGGSVGAYLLAALVLLWVLRVATGRTPGAPRRRTGD